MNETVADKLARELRKLGLDDMAVNAEHGVYGDFTSLLVAPKMALVEALANAMLNARETHRRQAIRALRKRVMNGEFDG